MLDEYDAPILQTLGHQAELTGIPDVLRGFGRASTRLQNCPARWSLGYKLNGTAQAALRRMEKQGYHLPYRQEVCPVVGLGANFDREKRQITEWQARICNAE